MKKISPFLWFNNNAEEAATFYLSIFPSGCILAELRHPENSFGPAGSIITLELELAGQQVTFLNGGPGHPPTDAFSFFIRCNTQTEIDDYWTKLSAGGSEMECGWLKDRFGLCWQVVPANIMDLIRPPAGMRAMMTMKKLDIAALEKAASS